MDKVVVEKEVVVADGEGTGSNAIWAIAFVIIVAIIAGALYYSGALRRAGVPGGDKVDVEVSVPASAPAR